MSNLIGLSQRTIIVARYGGQIEIEGNTGISGSTIYSMARIEIGNDVLIGGNCKIIDNDFHPLSVEKRIPLQKVEDIKKNAYQNKGRMFYPSKFNHLEGDGIGKNWE